MKTVLLSLLMLGAGSLVAADVSGKWSGTVDFKEDGESRTISAVLILKQDGNTVTGTAGQDENDLHSIRKGSIDGEALTLEIDGGDVVYYLELKVAGDEITGDARRGDESARMKVSLKRVKES